MSVAALACYHSKNMKLLSEKPNAIRAGGVDQVVEHLTSKHKALSSNTSTAKKKKKQDKHTLLANT
jgi:hypothetical protein